jgi:hypothetical protein
VSEEETKRMIECSPSYLQLPTVAAGTLRAYRWRLDWGGEARNSFELFVGLKPMGIEHPGSIATPWRSGDGGAIDSLRHFRARFVYLGYCHGRFGLGAGNGALLFSPSGLSLMSCNGNFSILDGHGRCILCNKESLGHVAMSSMTSFSLLSPVLDVKLPEEERSSGEQKGNQRGN